MRFSTASLRRDMEEMAARERADAADAHPRATPDPATERETTTGAWPGAHADSESTPGGAGGAGTMRFSTAAMHHEAAERAAGADGAAGHGAPGPAAPGPASAAPQHSDPPQGTAPHGAPQPATSPYASGGQPAGAWPPPAAPHSGLPPL
ncbi:hypothetical protein ACFVBJ_24925, partial [Streptomyces sp. NPDC057676]